MLVHQNTVSFVIDQLQILWQKPSNFAVMAADVLPMSVGAVLAQTAYFENLGKP
jgi:hypothetical protein